MSVPTVRLISVETEGSMADPSDSDRDIGPTWVLLRPLPESDQHPGSPTARMRRLLKAMLRGYGIRCERITAAGPDRPADANVAKGATAPAHARHNSGPALEIRDE